jgi:hypothetical protein
MPKLIKELERDSVDEEEELLAGRSNWDKSVPGTFSPRATQLARVQKQLATDTEHISVSKIRQAKYTSVLNTMVQYAQSEQVSVSDAVPYERVLQMAAEPFREPRRQDTYKLKFA